MLFYYVLNRLIYLHFRDASDLNVIVRSIYVANISF